MTVDSVVKLIQRLPAAKTLGDDKYIASAVPDMLGPVTSYIAHIFDWDFVLNEYQLPIVGGQANYVISGAANDLDDIVIVRYGTRPLQKMRQLDAYDFVSAAAGNIEPAHENSALTGGVNVWYQSGVDSNNYPKIVLVDTPQTSDVPLNIQYRKRNINIQVFPQHFDSVFACGVLSYLDPKYDSLFEKKLSKKVRDYKRGGKDMNPMQADPQWVNTNNKIAWLNGRA